MIKSLAVLALGTLISCTGTVNDHADDDAQADDHQTETVASSATAPDATDIEHDVEDATAAPVAPASNVVEELTEERATQPAPEHESIHAPFEAIMKQHVRNELVDYLLIRRDEHEALDAYLDTLAGTDVTAMTRDEQLAYYINLYNATMVRVIIRRVSADYSVSEKDFGVFDEPLVRLKNKSVSLNQLEHEIIRPTFKDPRIHAALVCGARSCPPLLPRAYRADDLDEVLTKNVQDWLADSKRNVIEVRKRELRVSSIFDWYAEDFGGKGGIDDFVNAYVPANVRGYSVAFMPYSWDLNIAAPADGTWVRSRSNVSTTYAGPDGGRYTLRLRAGDVVESVGSETDGRVMVRVPFEGTTVAFSADTFETYRPGR